MAAKTPRERRLQSVYGITQEQYDELLRFQDGRCAVCRREPAQGEVFVVDHDHFTKEIRGLLCRYDNHHVVGKHRVGLAGVYLLRQAAAYLEFPPAQQFGLGTVPVKKRRRKSVRVKAMNGRKAA